jgi:hypothetical protein
MGSSVYYEALAFGLATTMVHHNGIVYYEDDYKNNLFTFTTDPYEIISYIQNKPEKNIPIISRDHIPIAETLATNAIRSIIDAKSIPGIATKGTAMATTEEQVISALNGLWSKESYLRNTGWFESVITKSPLDETGNPIPWITYAGYAFLKNRVKPDFHVFEYGSGHSTLWWGKHVSRVVSCEHNAEWYEKIKPRLSGNVDYKHVNLVRGGDYCKVILQYQPEFDVIVIDGRDRVNCSKNVLGALKPTGIIIWDDSDRESYNEGYEFLKINGFKRIDFWGMGPGLVIGWCTSIFYRQDNCFDI